MHNPTSQHQFSLFLLPKQNNIIILKIVNLASFFIVSTEAINLMYVVVKRAMKSEQVCMMLDHY